METTTKTAKEIYLEVKANPARKRFGFGEKAVNDWLAEEL